MNKFGLILLCALSPVMLPAHTQTESEADMIQLKARIELLEERLARMEANTADRTATPPPPAAEVGRRTGVGRESRRTAGGTRG